LLTGLISAPREYPHDVWIPFVISGAQARRGPELDGALTELLRCHETIASDLARGLPVGPRDEDLAAAQWCRGYLASASTCREWQADARGRQLLVPFVQLAVLDASDPREAGLAALAQGAPELWLASELPALAAAVHAHFEPQRNPQLARVSVTVGRELPCTCGSRRRYRQCCSLN
jgi:uncharacterized protein YecA (UPF0149 family)